MIGIDWLDPGHILGTAGSAALWITLGIIFAECGVLLGFFLPGDTLLFTVGVFIANDVVDHSVWFACVVLGLGAILGNICGYEIGRAVGPRVFESGRQRLLRPEHVERTQAFFERFGAPAIILARFVPIVRTVITVLAGVARMDRRRYLVLSAVGGMLWVFSVTLLGYFLGGVPFVRDFVEPHLDLVLLGVVLLSVLPVGVHLLLDVR
ncbi:MAG: DedA family protein, partial [Nocardioidaceae bacterium]